VRIAAASVVFVSLLFTARARAGPTVEECVAQAEKGQFERDSGHYRTAESALGICANAGCPTQIHKDCTQWLSDLVSGAPTIVFVVRDEHGADLENAVVSMDGEVIAPRIDGRAVRADPGKHEFVFQSAHRAAVHLPLLVHVGVKDRVVSVQLGPRDDGAPKRSPADDAPKGDAANAPPSTQSTWPPVGPLVLTGGGVVALGAAAYLWISARNELSTLLSEPCAATRGCSVSDVNSIRTRLIVGDVLAGAGLAAVGAAVWLWVSHGRSVRAALTVTPNQARFATVF
jgi:hypothetical protein